MKCWKLIFCISVYLPFIAIAKTQPVYQPVKELAERRVAWLAPHLAFDSIAKEDGKDAFELSSKDNKINIAASSCNAAAMGLNWYLKYYCRRSMSHLGDNLSAVDKIPVVENKIRVAAEFPIRYALNYCTINYTMSFYKWADWERELDWMALNGINLMLTPVGTEAVWQNTLKHLGFTDKEISDFIAGPAFTAWWLMGNLEGWGGPVSQKIIDQQVALQKKILRRMKELGIEPVLQGFYGMAPTTLKKKVSAKIIEQGKWAGGFQRPDFLLPEDPLFEKAAGIYYIEMKKLYGSDIHYFGADPFHEGGKSNGLDVTKSAMIIQQIMQQYFPNSTWVLMGWHDNPSKELLSGLDKAKTLIIELFGENTNNWENRNAYEGTPFIWSNVSNFGEKVGLYGKLQRFAAEVYRAKHSKFGNYLKGVGIIPEGINNNPVAFDLMTELAWHTDSVDVKDWIKNYVQYRYGVNDEKLQQAWQLLLQTVYSSPDVSQEGPPESIFCARPAENIKSVSTWGTRKRNYDLSAFEEAVKIFVAADDKITHTETYRTDMIDLVRQVNANHADATYQQMMNAIKAKDQSEFKKSYQQFEQTLLEQDSLLRNSPYFSLSRWLMQANDFGTTSSDKRLALRNAKIQISYWGPDNPNSDLHDYANKEWSGLLSSLYLERWRKFAHNTIQKMNNQKVDEDYFSIEKKWADDKNLFINEPLSIKHQNEIIRAILEGPKEH
ncbi:MAG TPA: alpha-N-acetylglucosaminidase [Parafilimonas sp.]|nr:alpha-N-acetylglucosaminidase [Parafilimonas sp.]